MEASLSVTNSHTNVQTLNFIISIDNFSNLNYQVIMTIQMTYNRTTWSNLWPSLTTPRMPPLAHMNNPVWIPSNIFTVTSPSMLVGWPSTTCTRSWISRYRRMTYANSTSSTKWTGSRSSGDARYNSDSTQRIIDHEQWQRTDKTRRALVRAHSFHNGQVITMPWSPSWGWSNPDTPSPPTSSTASSSSTLSNGVNIHQVTNAVVHPLKGISLA